MEDAPRSHGNRHHAPRTEGCSDHKSLTLRRYNHCCPEDTAQQGESVGCTLHLVQQVDGFALGCVH